MDTASTQLKDPIPTYGKSQFQIRAGVVSVVGNVREHNEDNYYVPGQASLNNKPVVKTGPTGKRDDSFSSALTRRASARQAPTQTGAAGRNPSRRLWLLDLRAYLSWPTGWAGSLPGEKASQMAVEMIPAELARRLTGAFDDKSTQKALREAVAKANEEILALSHIGH